MTKKWDTTESEELFKAILLLDDVDEAKSFFRDLLTETEIKEFSNRFKAARMLREKKPYTTIEKATGLSTATIARISKWLKSGMGGYKKIIKKYNLHHHPVSRG